MTLCHSRQDFVWILSQLLNFLVYQLRYTKAAIGSCSVKKVFWVVLLPGNLRCSGYYKLSWEKELFCWKWRHMGKISCFVKNLYFCLGYWGVLDFNPGDKLRAPSQNWVFWWRFIYFPAILTCSFVVIACFLGKWWRSFLSSMSRQTGTYSDLVNQEVLLSNWIPWKVHLIWVYFLHQKI